MFNENFDIDGILDESDNNLLDENINGVTYVITFKTQNLKLIEQIKSLVEENE